MLSNPQLVALPLDSSFGDGFAFHNLRITYIGKPNPVVPYTSKSAICTTVPG